MKKETTFRQTVSPLVLLMVLNHGAPAKAFWFFKTKARRSSAHSKVMQAASYRVTPHQFNSVRQPPSSFQSISASTPQQHSDASLIQPEGYIARKCPHCGKIKYFKTNLKFNAPNIADKKPIPSTLGADPTPLPPTLAPSHASPLPLTLPYQRRQTASPTPPNMKDFVSPSDLVRPKQPVGKLTPPTKTKPAAPIDEKNPSALSDSFGVELSFILPSGAANECMGSFVSKHRNKVAPTNYCEFGLATAGHCVQGDWTHLAIAGIGMSSPQPKQNLKWQVQPGFELEGAMHSGKSDVAFIPIQAPCESIKNHKIIPLAPTASNGTVMLSKDRRLFQQKRFRPLLRPPQNNPYAHKSQWVKVNQGGGGLIEGEYGSYQALLYYPGEAEGEIYDYKLAREIQKKNPHLQIQTIPGAQTSQWRFLVSSKAKSITEVGDSGGPIVNEKGQLAGITSGTTPGRDDFTFEQTGVHFIKQTLANQYPSGQMDPEFQSQWNPPKAKVNAAGRKSFLDLLARR